MMATSQSCLITSFFKSPPKDDLINKKPTSTKCSSQEAMENEQHANPAKPPVSPSNLSNGEDPQSDLNSLGGGDSDHADSASDEESFVRKPLVVNLAGLLSPEIVNTFVAGEGKRQRKISEMCGSFKEGGLVNEMETRTEMKSIVKDPLKMPECGNTKSNASARMDCVATTNLESSCPEITKEFPKSELCVVSTYLKQSVLSWGSSAQPVFGTAVGLPAVEEQVEEGMRDAEPETKMVIGSRGEDGPVNGSEMCNPEGEVVGDERERRRKRRHTRELDACENSPGGLVSGDRRRKIDPVIGGNGEEGGEPMVVGGGELDDSFEDFIKSVQKKRKKKHKRRKKSNSNLTSLGETDSCISLVDFNEEELIVVIKRPRRSVAVSAAEKILSVQHKVEKVSEDTQEKDDDNASLTEPKSKTADVVIVDSECRNVESVHRNEPSVPEGTAVEESVIDDSVIIVSMTSSPSSSPQKLSQFSPQKESSSSNSHGSLSSEWAKIFKQSKGVEKGESKDESSIRSPKSSRRMRGPASTQSPKRYRSPSHSPRRCSSPRNRSPYRSPALKNCGKHNLSPLKQSHISRRQLSFSASSTGTCDSAPFEGLVHVQQRDPDEQFWNLTALRPVPAMHTPPTSHLETALGSGGSLGLVEPACMPQVTPPLPQVCSVAERDHILSQLQKTYPDQDVEWIYSHYRRIASLPEMSNMANPISTSEPATKQPHKLSRTKKEGRGGKRGDSGCKEDGRHTRKNGGSKGVKGPLMCSISICNPRNGGVKDNVRGKICVNVAAYKSTESVAPRRKSRRLSQKKQESTSEIRQCKVTKDTNNQVRSKVDADSSGRVSPATVPQPSCKPGLFGSELWTEIYRPQQASEVIGNGAQVKQLHSWLCDWRVRCSSQRDAVSTDGVSESTRSSSGTKRRGTAAMRHLEESSGSSSSKSSIPSWVSEEDNDFISLAYLRRKHSGSALSFPDSSETDEESSGEEEGVCPVTILCGDHGSGKTAAVYACAQELGYKVLEVNSTSVRSKQNVLATLREATLSHRVTTNPWKLGSDGVGATSERHKSGNEKKTAAAKPPPTGGICAFFKPMKGGDPSGLTELNKKVGVNKGGNDMQSKAKRKRKSKASSTIVIGSSSEGELGSTVASTEHAQSGASVTLATATVILLEEVDVLFEEERGFWSAVYELIATTKRPIVMTCNDSRYELECDHQKLVFNQPALSELSLHMQLLCLSHGAHVTPEVANQIVAFLKCDIRKAVTLLHFWLTLQSPSNGRSDTSSEPSATVGGELAVEDRGLGEVLVGGPNEVNGRGISVAPLSLEHVLGMSSMQREVLRRVFMETDLLGSEDSFSTVLCDVVAMVHQGGLDLTHPLNDPVPLSQDGRCTSREVRTEGLSPGNNMTSENGNFVPTPLNQGTKKVSTCSEASLGGSKSSHIFTIPWKHPHHCVHRTASKYHSLDSVSNMCDILSYMDTAAMVSCDSHVTENHQHECFSPWWTSMTEMSLCSELPLTNEQKCSVELNINARAAMEALALGERWSHGDSWGYSQDDPYGLLAAAKQTRRVEAVHSACVECAEAFGTHWEPSHVAMATDCLPALQLMCHSENLREAANTKRRFRHYLSSSIVDLQHLKSFPNIAAFPHRPPSST